MKHSSSSPLTTAAKRAATSAHDCHDFGSLQPMTTSVLHPARKTSAPQKLEGLEQSGKQLVCFQEREDVMELAPAEELRLSEVERCVSA
ncbi:hypothetical protein NMY22_g6159 [Coprinellus aureogranulatus]|nr:hypothetical protein NMY22_g6159 [Coprinellus aureogranulatus]